MRKPNITVAPTAGPIPGGEISATVYETPARARWTVAIGGTFVLAAAAAISYQGLRGLGQLMRVDHPWLLPIAIDAYASICTLLVIFLPGLHFARPAVIANARIGLAMSVLGNIVDRGLTLGHWTPRDIALTFIGAWPSIIVERVLYLQGKLALPPAPAVVQSSESPSIVQPSEPSTGIVQEPSTDERPAPDGPSIAGTVHRPAAPSTDRPRRPSTARPKPSTPPPSTGQPDKDVWVEIGHPVYLAVRARVGKRPPEGEFHAALIEECARLIVQGELPACYADPSLTTAKRVRKDVETRFPELSPLHLIREAS